MIDAEGSRDNLLGVAFYDDDIREYITDPDQIRLTLTATAVLGKTFVAHNASYDLPVIFWTLDIPMRAVYYDGHFNRGQWRYDPKRPMCELWDSLNLAGNLSVEALGKAIGLEKYATPQVLQGKDPDRYGWICEKHERGECIECYALRDAEIVHRYLESLTEVVSGWSVAPTCRIAGLAQSVWRSLDRPDPIAINDGRIKYLARKAFFGGRVETFKLGHLAPLYTADVTSMYPSVMLEGRFPDPDTMLYVGEINPADLPLDLEGVCEALVDVPVAYVPPLPNSHRGLRVFATGLQRGHWTFAELRYAQTAGCRILRVYRATWATRSLSPFSTFIGVLWEARQEYKRHGDPREQVIKVLLNSAYGRLGLRGGMTQETVEPWDPRLSMADYVKIQRKRQGNRRRRPDGLFESSHGVYPEIIDGKPYVRFGNTVPFEHKWVNVLWAAQITALARVKLHRYLMMQGASVAYCDTDSVFATSPIQGLGEGLGALADHTCYTSGWLVGPKLYALETSDGTRVTRAKGIPRDKAEAFLRGDEVIFDSPISPRAQRHGGPKAGQWVQIHRERQLVPHRRSPVHPELLQSEYGWSDTIPPHIGP